ncbi:unnamed protein product [Boreogadus saida]
MLKSASVSVASLARPGQFGHLGEVCCYGTGRYGTDANEPTRARHRNLSWMKYSPCDDHGHNKGDEPSFPVNGHLSVAVGRRNCGLATHLYRSGPYRSSTPLPSGQIGLARLATLTLADLSTVRCENGHGHGQMA